MSLSGSFAKDGRATLFLEKLPIAGLAAAGVHAVGGNPQEARRAIATSTNGLVTASFTIAGTMFFGPAGAVAGAALGSATGIGIEHGISLSIQDPSVKKEVGEINGTRLLLDIPLSALGAGLGGGGTGSLLTSPFKEGAKEGVKEGVEEGIKAGAKTVILAGVGAMAGHIPGRTIDSSYGEMVRDTSDHDSEGIRNRSDFTIAPMCTATGADLSDWDDCAFE